MSLSSELDSYKADLFANGFDPIDAGLLDDSFEQQRRFVEDTSRFKLALCSRRAAKSYAAALMAYRTAFLFPKCRVIVLGQTLQAVRDVFMKDILDVIEGRMDFEVRKVNSEYRFPNGSVIQLMGADAAESSNRRRLGIKARLIILDEVQSWENVDLRDLVSRVLRPMLTDQLGQLVMCGTPGVGRPYFFHAAHRTDECNDGIGTGWSVHSWTQFDNPHVAAQAREDLEQITAANPDFLQSAKYKRDYLGVWADEADDQCLRASPVNFQHDSLPSAGIDCFILGVDLGFSPDPTAFCLVGWKRHEPTLYVVSAWTELGIDHVTVAERIDEVATERAGLRIVIDQGSDKQGVETMRRRYSKHHLEPADKSVKVANQLKMLRTDLDRGLVQLLPDTRDRLSDEWARYVWDPRAKAEGKLQPKSGVPDHMTDAFRYAWFIARNYSERPKREPADAGLSDYVKSLLKKQKRSLAKQAAGEDFITDAWDVSDSHT